MNCDQLETVVLPDNIEVINSAFWHCKSLKNINMPEYVKNMDGAFSGCESLESITLPKPKGNNIYCRYSSSFEGCLDLKTVTVPKEVEQLHDTFKNCINLEKVVFEGDKIALNDATFENCEKLQIMCSRKLEKCLPKKIKEYVYKDEKRKAREEKKKKAVEAKDTVSEDTILKNTGGVKLYEVIDNYNVAAMLKDITGSETTVYLAAKRKKFFLDGIEFKVNCRIGKDLEKYRYYFNMEYVDIFQCSKSIIGTEDARNLICDDNSDAWMYVYALADPGAETLDKNTVDNRVAFLVTVGHILSQDEIMQDIVKMFPKKKDGTFNKNRIMRLASDGMIVREKPKKDGTPGLYNKIFEIVAKPKDDVSLTITADYRSLTPTECESVLADYVAQHCEALGVN